MLVLNPDVVLVPGFIERLMAGGAIDPQVGTVCGRLLAIGWQERDDGRFRKMEYVFGASAAAAMYRREMIADISQGSDFFDPDFFAYREDADVAWRAQLLGWRCLYVPGAVGYHVRSVGPGNRRAVPSAINRHSVKNRFLMRVKNMTGGLYRRFWMQATLRDIVVLCGCVLWEPSSLPAFWQVARCLPRALRRRRWIMARRRVTDESLAHWFRTEPFAQPVAEDAELVQKTAYVKATMAG